MDLYPDLEANYTHDHLAVWHKSVDFLKDPRFVEAYRRQNTAWVKTLNTGAPNIGASAWDGYCSTAVAEAGVEALHTGKTIAVTQIAKPKFYM